MLHSSFIYRMNIGNLPQFTWASNKIGLEQYEHMVPYAKLNNNCQKWDSNPRLENQTATWTQRLRPLGHPDICKPVFGQNSHNSYRKKWFLTPQLISFTDKLNHLTYFHQAQELWSENMTWIWDKIRDLWMHKSKSCNYFCKTPKNHNFHQHK